MYALFKDVMKEYKDIEYKITEQKLSLNPIITLSRGDNQIDINIDIYYTVYKPIYRNEEVEEDEECYEC